MNIWGCEKKIEYYKNLLKKEQNKKNPRKRKIKLYKKRIFGLKNKIKYKKRKN